MDKLLNAVATKEKAKAARIAVWWRRVKKFKCSIILSQPHGLLPAEWVAVRFHHAELTQFEYRHFYDFMKAESENLALPAMQTVLP